MWHLAANKFITNLFNIFHGYRFTDVETCGFAKLRVKSKLRFTSRKALGQTPALEVKRSRRELVAEFLSKPVRADCWVRVNPLDCDDFDADLAAIVPAAPHGIVVVAGETTLVEKGPAVQGRITRCHDAHRLATGMHLCRGDGELL